MFQRVITVIVIVVLVAGGGYYAFQQLMPPPAEEAAGPTYATKEVTRGDLEVGVELSGPLNPSRGGSIQIPWQNRSFGPGGPPTYYIDEILAKEGDAVKRDQVLIRLSAPDLPQQIDQAREKLRLKQESLASLMGVDPAELDQINPYQGITIRAPIKGRVTDFEDAAGTQLKEGEVICRIVNDSRFKLTAKLTPGEFDLVRTDQPAVLRFDQFDGVVPATITTVNPEPVPESTATLIDSDSSIGSGTGEQDEYQFVYWVTVEGENPGLVTPGMKATVGIPEDAEQINSAGVTWFRYQVPIEGYVDEENVLSTAEAAITRVFVQNMQTVEAGDPLVALGGDDARQVIEQKMAEIRQAEMELDSLLNQLNNLEVRASMDGVIARYEPEVAVGQQVDMGRWLGNIYNTGDMEMYAQVDDVDVLLIQTGAPVEVTVDAVQGKTFEGSVTYVSTAGMDQKGIAQFSVNINVKGGPELRPGMQARAYVKAGSAKDVLLVPLEAIFEEDGQTKVEILENNLPRAVPVELGLMNDRVAEVKSGVEEGQLVITGSSADLLPSQHVQGDNTILPAEPGGDEQPPETGAPEPVPSQNGKPAGEVQ